MDDPRARHLLERLRASGARVTAPRAAVVSAMVRPGVHHLTAAELVDELRRHDPGFHESTVYRTLDRLVAAGAVTRIESDGGPAVYHVAEAPHHHLVCDRCGRVLGVPADALGPLARALRRDHGFVLRPDAVTLPGRCVDCTSGTGTAAPAAAAGPGATGPGATRRSRPLAHDH